MGAKKDLKVRKTQYIALSTAVGSRIQSLYDINKSWKSKSEEALAKYCTYENVYILKLQR